MSRTLIPAAGTRGERGEIPMIYLPSRVTVEQHARLVALRDLTGVTISEHVRLALDPYLSRVERKAQQSLPEETAGSGSAAAAPGASPPKVKPAAVAARPPRPAIARQPTARTR